MALSAALNTSHATMPNIVLEPDERADIVTYILCSNDAGIERIPFASSQFDGSC